MRAKVVLLIAAALGVPSSPVPIHAQNAGQRPAFERAADALERVTWRTRTLVGDDRLTNWDFAIATQTLPGLTFIEGVIRADAASVDFVEGSNTQQVSRQLTKRLDHSLTLEERVAVVERMGPMRMISYRVDVFPTDAVSQRRLFAFARDLRVQTLVVPAGADPGALDPLATEYGINVVLQGDALAVVKTLEGRSRRLGIGIDTGSWGQDRRPVQERLALVKDRLLHVTLRDPSGRGTEGSSGDLAGFFQDLDRSNVRPLVLSLDATGLVGAAADLFRAVEAFETVVQPAYGRHFTEFSRTVPIRRDLVRAAKGETLSGAELERRSEDVRRRIRAAIPSTPYRAPRKPRRLLVIESLQGMSHDTIPHANVMLEEMGRMTGAWTTEFDNNLANLTYPKVKEYDGIFLNSIVGEFAPDQGVRDGLLRFVREGGGVGGVHGTPWASRNWDEFGVLFGAKSAPHRIEQGVMKVYDTASPIVAPFGGKPLNFREEYYRFEHQGTNRLRWEDVRVLLTVDLDDPAIEPRPWTGYKRPDNTYPVSWIRTYGKGRMFYSSLGHLPDTFMTPEIVGHFLAGVQFLLGDLDADTTPNPRQGTSAQGATAPPPAVPSISQRPTGSSLGTIRVGASDGNIWFGWRVAAPTAAFKTLTVSDALARLDRLSVANVELSALQPVSPEVPKPLDHRLQPGERGAVMRRLRELNEQVLAYRVDRIDPDMTARRKQFEFAKSLNAALIIVSSDASRLDELDALAEEFAVDVAVESKSDPAALMQTVAERSPRIGIAADLGAWMQAGLKPVDGLALVQGRLRLVKVSDRSALGPNARVVPVGAGAGGLGDFFLAAYKAGIRPLAITIESSGAGEADLVKNLTGFEQVMWPAMAERVRAMLQTPAGTIRGPERLEPDMRKQIEAATPRRALVPPKKTRKLLVTDIQMYSGHSTIPHGNLLLELMGKETGAFEPVFSNDLGLLTYPKIKEFDAIYLNNVCGMVYNDPEVREGILRFVREGGGIGGHHAVTFSNNHWPEFADMMGGWAGAHHVEKQMIKVDDPASPLTRSFGSASFEHTDEFYQFPPSSPYSRKKQRVLLSIDVDRSDRATENRFCEQCTRPDQDYGLAWIKTYGKGRAYFTPLGHTTSFYTDPRWTEHLLAAIQYILGDLDADATPD